VFVSAALDVERKMVVRRGAFHPQPRVDSAVVVLTPRAVPWSRETDEFRAVVKAAFAQRRKTLRNAWSGLPNVTSALVEMAAEKAGVDLDARGETLDAATFARMATELSLLRS
jgi:16S rRNA (adenine1518-N6/adenine1519-N6)-dimethyltransferase